MRPIANFQIGKAGILKGTLQTIYSAFKTHKQVRISVLKSSGRDRESIKGIAQEIVQNLPWEKGKEYIYRIIGFTIVLNRRSSS